MKDKILDIDETSKIIGCILEIKDYINSIETEVYRDTSYAPYILEKIEPIIHDSNVIKYICKGEKNG